MQTIGVAIITYNETESIKECIESFEEDVDQIVVAIQDNTPQETIDAIKSASPKVGIYNFGPWIDDFAAKRNFSFSHLTTDWLMWVDSDDIIYQPENLRKLAENAQPEVGGIWFPYHYSIDEFGNLTTLYERERLLRRSCGWIWKGRLHETVSPLIPTQYVRSDEVIILHRHRTGVDRGVRNFTILNKMLKETPEDKRVWLYLGHQNFAGQHWTEAAQWYLKFGSDEGAILLERYQALCYACKALRELNDKQAIEVALMCIDLFPQYKDGYVELAFSYLKNGQLDKAIHFAKLSQNKELMTEPPAIIFINPLEYSFNTLAILAECHLKKMELNEALNYLSQAYQIRPTRENEYHLRLIENEIKKNRVDEAIKLLAVHLLDNKEITKLNHLVQATPWWWRDTEEFPTLVAGVDHHNQQIENKPELVDLGKGKAIINIDRCINPEVFLEQADQNFEHITVTSSRVQDNVDQFNIMAFSDMERLITSKDGRHIINFQEDDKRIWAEYDFKKPTDMLIRLFLGKGLEHWNPKTIREIGCGGSETWAAETTYELEKLNNHCILYAMDKQIWDGVYYRPTELYNAQSSPCNLFISSRNPDVFYEAIPAQQKWLWCHDIHCWDRLTPDVAKELDCIVGLSHWHIEHLKRTYPFLKDCEVIDLDDQEKTYDDLWTPATFFEDTTCYRLPKMAVIGNALRPERFKREVEKIPHSFIWMSSPDRGLEQVLELWPLLKEALPDATLNIYYGWEYFDSTLFIDSQRALKAKLLQLVRQDGVQWCGRIGQEQLALELLRTDCLLYPPPHDFRETYGISFLEAQAAGVINFYRMNGALGETVGERGIPLGLDFTQQQIVDTIVKTLEDVDLCEKLRHDGREYALARSWEGQAKKILQLFKQIGGDEVKRR